MNLIAFAVADKEYAVEITQVVEVIRSGMIISVPDSASFVEGVINFRGKVVPIINLRKKFGVQKEELKRKNRIIIIQAAGHFIGIIVDIIVRVMAVDPDTITPPDKILNETKYFIGVVQIQERLIFIMDVAKLFSGKEKTGIEEVHEKVEIRKPGD